MSLLSAAASCPVSRGSDRERPLANDIPVIDAENAEGSSRAVGPLSRESEQPAESLSLSGYAGEETREAEYRWVHSSVLEFFSVFTKVSLLQDFVDSVDIVLDGVPSGAFALRRCREFETVCLGRGEGRKDFFYFYSCLFSDMHIRLPLDSFTMEVLRVLNVAPTQLHPNSWAAIQAFRLLCDVLSLRPTARSCRPNKK